MCMEAQEIKVIQVRMEKEFAEAASKKAKEAGLNLSQVIRVLLKEYLENPQGRLSFNN